MYKRQEYVAKIRMEIVDNSLNFYLDILDTVTLDDHGGISSIELVISGLAETLNVDDDFTWHVDNSYGEIPNFGIYSLDVGFEADYSSDTSFTTITILQPAQYTIMVGIAVDNAFVSIEDCIKRIDGGGLSASGLLFTIDISDYDLSLIHI